MVLIDGTQFLMGTESSDGFPDDGEGPIRQITVDPFYIDQTQVTNRQFSRFVRETGFVSESERFGWSFVFDLLVPPRLLAANPRRVNEVPWWVAIEGASWKHLEGPASNVKKRPDHPVVQVSWNDAQAYCQWSGKRLPSEAEWEFAARGGLAQAAYPWGDELTPEGNHRANIWQGKFPDLNTRDDGYLGPCPVKTFPANGYGLFEVAGNVWEWCSDWFSPNHHLTASPINPKGPDNGAARVMRGGSYLCHDSYCNRYRVAARNRNTPDTGAGNLGFRCAADA